MAPKPRLWLSCPPLDAVPVGTEPVIVGRDAGCELHLPHQAVSRRHGLVRSVGGEVVYENKSKQGTFVNGRKVTFMCKLSAGDSLEIGPYTIQALAEPPAVQELDGTLQLDKGAVSLKAKLKDAMLVVRKLEAQVQAKAAEAQAKAAEAEAKAAEAEAKGREVVSARRELESEVWRGFAANRELNEARERVAELQRKLEEHQGEA